MNLPFFIARRCLSRHKGTFSAFIIRLAIISTALSVAVMIVAMAFINGFQYTIRAKMYSFLGHVHVESYDKNHSQYIDLKPIKLDAPLMKRIAAIPHVRQVAAFASRPTIIHSGSEMEGIQLKGIEPNYQFPSELGITGHRIDYSDSGYSKQILLSTATANRLNVAIGDTVQLYFLEPGNITPRIRKVVICGLYHTGVEDVDKFYGICDIRLLQRINGWQPNDINGYQVDLTNEKYSDTTASIIFDFFRDPEYVNSSLTTFTIRDIFPNVFDWLGTQDVTRVIVLVIMAIVAIINLAASLMMIIVDRARMVGLLKALGMAATQTRQVFLYYAGLIAGVGVLAGNLLAISLCLLEEKLHFLKLDESTYYMKYVPVRFNWWAVAAVDGATLLVCILCMWLPTLYIRRIQPARVLQFK
ncbi:MAG: ABC transporter permease [Flavipsychrobacter sp.]